MVMHLVMKRRSQGAIVQLIAPSDTICPAMVHTIPADRLDSSRARAKIVPAMGAMVVDRSLCTTKSEPENTPEVGGRL